MDMISERLCDSSWGKQARVLCLSDWRQAAVPSQLAWPQVPTAAQAHDLIDGLADRRRRASCNLTSAWCCGLAMPDRISSTGTTSGPGTTRVLITRHHGVINVSV